MAGCQSLTNSKTLCVTLQPGHFIQETLSFMYRSTIAARPFLTKTSCKKDRKAQIELDFPCPGTRVSLSDLRVFLHANTLRLKLVSSGAYTHVDFSPRLRFTSTDGKRKVAQVLRALQGRKEKRDNTVLDVLDWLDSDAILSSCDSLSTNGDDDRDDHEQVMKLDKGTLSEVVTLQWAELWMAHCQRTLQIFSQFVDDPEVFGLSLIPKFTGRGGQRDADSVVPIYRVRLTGGSVSRLEKDEGVQETLSVGFVHESQSKKDILEHLADARRMFEPLMDPLRSTKKDLHALSAASIILPLLSVKDPAAPVSWPTAESGQNDQRNRNRKRPDCNIGVTLQYVHARLCGCVQSERYLIVFSRKCTVF